MSVFTSTCFLFLRDPRGGVEDLDRMRAAGFAGVFCNIGDHTPAEWEAVVRPRALAAGMYCGPWARTQGSDGAFSETILAAIIQCAMRWQSPLIVNSESELKATGANWTTHIAEACEGFDAALSMEAWPFANVEWWPLADMPVLPQCFVSDGAPGRDEVTPQWHAYGVQCVFPTYSTYSDASPDAYDLTAPYSLYTGDDCGGDFARWSPRASGYQGCVEQPLTPDGDDMTLIGSQHGIDAAVDRLVKLDPGGSKPNRNPDDLSTWGAYDKLRRSLTILVDDHDGDEAKAADDAGV